MAGLLTFGRVLEFVVDLFDLLEDDLGVLGKLGLDLGHLVLKQEVMGLKVTQLVLLFMSLLVGMYMVIAGKTPLSILQLVDKTFLFFICSPNFFSQGVKLHPDVMDIIIYFLFKFSNHVWQVFIFNLVQNLLHEQLVIGTCCQTYLSFIQASLITFQGEARVVLRGVLTFGIALIR